MTVIPSRLLGPSMSVGQLTASADPIVTFDFDESKHPRGGDPANPGRFSPAEGEAAPKPEPGSVADAEGRIADRLAEHAYVNLTGADPVLATEIADRVDKFADEFPDIAKEVRGIAIGDLNEPIAEMEDRYLPENAIASTWWNNLDGYGYIVLSHDNYDNKHEFEQAMLRDAEMNYHPLATTSEPIDHELGHVLDYSLGGGGGNAAFSDHEGYWTTEGATISGYAQENPHEAFGEAFALRQEEGSDALDSEVLRDSLNQAIVLAGGHLTKRDKEPVTAAARPRWSGPTCRGFIGPGH